MQDNCEIGKKEIFGKFKQNFFWAISEVRAYRNGMYESSVHEMQWNFSICCMLGWSIKGRLGPFIQILCQLYPDFTQMKLG